MPFNSDFNSNNKAPSLPPSTLLRSNAFSISTSRTNTLIYKKYSISTRIKALTILNNKVSMASIIKVIGIGQSQIYTLIVNVYNHR
jgi:glucose-6-phosphate dehydrogenase assembly protein OpcA